MSVAAYATEIYTAGSPVGFSSEPTTDLGDNKFQVTDTDRRLFDLNTLVIATDGAGNNLLIESVDFLNGLVTLVNPATEVFITGAFVTKSFIGGTKEYSYELNGDVLDNTSFEATTGNGGYRTRCYGLNDVSVSLSRYDDFTRDFISHKRSRERVLIEIRPGGGTDVLRGWFVVETSSLSGEVGGLEEESLSFLPAQVSSLQEGNASVSFQTT